MQVIVLLALFGVAAAGGPLGAAVAAPVAYAAGPAVASYGHQTYSAAPLAVAHHGYAAAPLAVAHHGYAAAPLAVAHHGYAAAPIAHHAYAAAPVAVARAVAPIVHAAPAIAVKTVQPEPYDAHPQYNYGYSVQDGLTGDAKNHQESRDGDVVQGRYSLVEPDGAVRTVTYTADPINGFNAVVDRQAPAVAVKQVVAAPVVHAAPVAVAHHGYAAAPIAHHAYAAAAPVAVAHHGYAAAPVAFGGFAKAHHF